MGSQVSSVEALGLTQNTHSNVGHNIHYLCHIPFNVHNDFKEILLLFTIIENIKDKKKPRFKETKLFIQGNTPNM